MGRLWVLVGCGVLLLACGGGPVSHSPTPSPEPVAQWGRTLPLDPKTYTSPSRGYALWVNPSEPDGEGKGFYRLSLKGKVVWEKELPFTFRDAAVADDGTSCGYAYTEGVMGLGNFEVAILAPDGALRADDKHAREHSLYPHTNPNPKVAGWFIDPDNDRVVVRIPDPDVNLQKEVWWVYKLSDGKRHIVTPAALGAPVRSLEDAKPLRGTNLTVVHWYQFENTMGSTFSLVDLEGNSVWRWDVPDDYESGEVGEKRYDLRGAVFEAGAIHDLRRPNQFELRLGKQAVRVRFQVEPQADGWRVTEVGREPFVEPAKPVAQKLAAPAVQLKVLRQLVVPLDTGPSSPIHDVGEFTIVPGDRFVFVRWGEKPSVCMVDSAGKLLTQMPLPKEGVGEGRNVVLGWVGGTSFVLVASEYRSKESAKAWRLNTESGMMRPLPAFDSFRVEAVAAFKDGSFAALTVEDSTFGMTDHVTLFDPEGRKLWDLGAGGGYSGRAGELLSPKDLAFDASGRVVVLDVIQHSLQFFGRDGKFVKVIDFDKKWNREMSYPTQLTSLSTGGFLILDFGADKPCIEVDADGTLVREFAPKLSNGKKVETHEDMRVDSKGRVWITNGEFFLGLDPKGLAVKTVGSLPPEAGIGSIGELSVALDGTVYALGRDNPELHAFAPDGGRKFIAKPLASDFDDKPWPSLEITRSGDIYLGGGTGDGDLHFSPEGKRLGYQPRPEGDAAGLEKPFQMRSTWRWYGNRLLNENGRTAAVLRRWPDQSWMLGGPDTMAPFGELMAYSGGSWQEQESDRRLGFFKPDGTPDGMARLSEGLGDIGSAAFDGRLSYFSVEAGLVAVDRAGKAVWVTRPEGWTSDWKVFPSMGGLALWDGGRTVIWVATPLRPSLP